MTRELLFIKNHCILKGEKKMKDQFLENIFRYQVVNIEKLKEFGFVLQEDIYHYETQIVDNQFILTIHISSTGNIDTNMIELAAGEVYTLYQVESAKGSFVGRVRAEYCDILQDIAAHCFDKEIFKQVCTKQIIRYVQLKYGDELEYLWEKTPNCAIWRRKDNQKWYGLITTICKNKLGSSSTEQVDIINLRIDCNELEKIVDGIHYFRAYHMNKKHWVSICLDGSVSLEDIQTRIEQSFQIASTNKKQLDEISSC